MRGIRVLLVAVMIGLAVAGTRALGAGALLPAPVTIDAGRFAYRIERDGRIHPIPRIKWPFPRDSVCCAAPGSWFALRRHHLVVGRGKRSVWRSQMAIRTLRDVGAVRFGSDTLAFTYRNNLYLAPLAGVEQPIGHAEIPLGFTSGGIYTYQWGRRLLLRSDAGTVVETIARWPFSLEYFVSGGRLYFIKRGVVISARGSHVRRLTTLSRLGMSRDTGLQPVGSLLELEDNYRLVLLRATGSVFASSALRESSRGGLSSSLVAAPHDRAVSFTATSGETETVYLLRAGSHRPVPLYRARVHRGGCVQGANVQWHGSWLLYGDTDGTLAVIDTGGAERPIVLTRLVRGMRGTRGGFSAYWSEQPPPAF